MHLTTSRREDDSERILIAVVEGDRIFVGERFTLSLQRTVRVPEDRATHPLPPGLGRLPLLPARLASAAVPASWRDSGDVLVPMYQREALWLAFGGAAWKPNAAQVAAGGINAVSGEPWPAELSTDPQNYLVTPDQPWLDGINAGSEIVRQFVAMPLGSGRTVEARVTGEEHEGGIQVRVYEPRAGRFPDQPPPAPERRGGAMRTGAPVMGLGAGGTIRQKIYRDPYGVDTWDSRHSGTVTVRILNSEQWREVTGHPAPPTPVSAEVYGRYGLPWFELYDAERADVAAAERLAGLEGTGDEPEPSGAVGGGDVRGIDRRQAPRGRIQGITRDVDR